MVWRRLFGQQPEPEDDHDSSSERRTDEQPSTSAERQPDASPRKPSSERKLPAHLAEQFGNRERRTGGVADLERKLATMKGRRTAALYDIEQGELATDDDNPWKQRIALLTESLETVEADRAEAEHVEPGPYHSVPRTPIKDVSVAFENDVATVRFAIEDQRFVYEEPLDWAERGHQITRTEMIRTSGDPATLLPDDTPSDVRDELRRHLEHSLFVMATELRDRKLDDEPLPENLSLADLAQPCPECGGWTDFRGRCQYCARRKIRLQELFRERDRLLNERASEMEERHRLAERLPLARRRLADVEREIEELERKIAEATE